jgi:hypothetical protein
MTPASFDETTGEQLTLGVINATSASIPVVVCHRPECRAKRGELLVAELGPGWSIG